MRTMSQMVLCGLLCAVVAVAARDPLPRATPASVGLDPARLIAVTELLKQFVAEQRIAGAVAAVARNGKLAYLEAVGVQDLDTPVPMGERSLFRIYSMTKAVTAAAVMVLHDEGRFQLSDPVSRYLPEFGEVRVIASADGGTRPPSRPITIEDLLLHTSGLSHRTSDEYRRAQVRSRAMTLPQFIANIVRVPLREDPGTRFRYSEATTVLGRLVEVWSGRAFDVFLNERLFQPLGMADTRFSVGPAERARLTTVYAPAPGGGLTPIEIEEVPFTTRPALLEGAVGLVSTVPDFLRFSQMLLDKGTLGGVRILRAATVDRMIANGLSADVTAARGGGMGWGLGNVDVVLRPNTRGYLTAPNAYGWDGSAGTMFAVDPGRDLIAILMIQSVPADPDGLRRRFAALVQAAVRD